MIRRRAIRSAFELLIALTCACGSDVEDVRVRLRVEAADESCRDAELDQIEAARLSVRGTNNVDGACFSLRDADTIAELNGELARSGVALGDLEGGAVTIALLGFDDEGCNPERDALCGTAAIELAEIREALIPVFCRGAGDPPPAYAECLGRAR
jgi:hypothetical protein